MDYKATLKERGFKIERGHPHPLGATPDENGVNFSIFSEQAEYVELLLFDKHDDLEPFLVLSTNRATELAHAGKPEVETPGMEKKEGVTISLNKTFHFWHVYVRGLKPGVHYAYRIGGPYDPEKGQRFDSTKVLIDPYSRGNNAALWDRSKACQKGEDNLTTSMRSVVISISDYDWEEDSHVILRKINEEPSLSGMPLDKAMPPELNETIIYEMHIRGFTKSPSSGVAHPGTFSGVIEKIPYLKQLGITAVELLPVFDFDDKEEFGKKNYWGYDPEGFFAPHSGHCSDPEHGNHLNEFRDMVKALHKEGIGVILDVVFNHTSEGDHRGPTYSLKGMDNSIYYHLEPQKQYYSNYSGCGNTINCNHPITQKMIVDSLKFWVQEMHVDGFRFDEGSIMSRGMDGRPMPYPPVIWQIELEDSLGYAKVIAEAWDAASLNQVGYFPGYRWAEWNGYFRDDIRRFVKGDEGLIGRVASRIAGSSDLYQSKSRLPLNSVNFVTCHDGFTLNDLVSYDCKHNEANGEGNRDGNDNNMSWNCGIEGETDDRAIEALRERQIKNFSALLLLSVGVPMICMGDEVRRTQKGNNNAYCQDNEISWFDWDLLIKNGHMFRFWKLMIDFRRRHSAIRRIHHFSGEENKRGLKDISWHGCKLNSPGWDDPHARALGFTMGGFDGEEDIHAMMNMYWDDLEFEIPSVKRRKWYRAIDTSLTPPLDIMEPGEEIRVNGNTYSVKSRSIVVLISKKSGKFSKEE